MSRWIKLSVWLLVILSTLSFKIAPNRWGVSLADPTIWIKICPENSATISENDISGNDPLAGISGLSFAQVLQSVIDNYNNVPGSYLRLALYPTDPNNPSTPATGDSVFTIAKGSVRTIEICFGSTNPAAGLAGGYAEPKTEGQLYVSCAIKAKPEHASKASFLTHLLTHELGHCFGLAHTQESTHSVMSYFGDNFLRLQHDDYAGLTYAYPVDESYAKETPTLGLTGCSPRN